MLSRKLSGDRLHCAERVVATVATVDLDRLVETEGVDRLLIASDNIAGDELVSLLRDADRLGVMVSVLPHFHEAIGAGAEIEDLEGTPLLCLGAPVLSGVAHATKRAFDLGCSLLLLVVLSPLLVVIAVAVKLDSRGPVIFRQERVGRGQRRFCVRKFRTMVDGADAMTAALRRASRDPHWLLLDNDPRVTRVGRWLRRTSLDELPQLWNVVRGEMSLVGPRPLVPAEQAHVADWGRRRLDVTPGLTGLWQVLGRTSIPFEEMVRLDCLYVANWSLRRDFELLLRTIPALLTARGAN
jgi:exopolysaccharide biosynthesis polyprenyl glycosylphosphotransferase